MKIQNVIVVYDVYVATGDGEDAGENARAAVLEFIRDAEQPLAVSEQNALPVTNERSIRDAWRGEKIIVARCVSDADYEKIKGKSTLDVFNMLHTKAGKDAAAKPK